MYITEDKLLALQERLKYLLNELDTFCHEHGVSYTLEGGTALGAFRHGDIIPWDDDIDVRMDLKEYTKFCEAYDQYGSPSFHLQRHKTDHLYFNEFAKIRDLHSFFKEDVTVTYPYNGVFIDIFVYEREFPLLVYFAHYLYRPLFALSHTPLEKLSLLSLFANVYYYIVRLFVLVFRGISRLFRAQNYSYTYGSNLNAFKYRYDYSMFNGNRYLKFGVRSYPVPVLIEDYLVAHYGESYMIPPPIDARVPHHIKELEIYPIEND